MAKRLTDKNADSVQLDSVLRMSGIEIPAEENPEAILMTASRAFMHEITEAESTDDYNDAADMFGTLAHIADHEAFVSESIQRIINAVNTFGKAIAEYEKFSNLNWIMQNGMNKEFRTAYDRYISYRKQFID